MGNKQDEVIGMVLLDPACEDQEETVLPLLPETLKEDYSKQFSIEGSHEDFQQRL